ncbi:MAG: HAD family phosphatase [Alphaproteobacteria bacterium]|nr:MAG: HAD family phosphatase [Alphaproteobacteria bacterium]
MPPKLVIFDCDGVLVDTEPVANAVVAESLQRYGLDLSVEECTARYTGWILRDIEAEVTASGISLPANWRDEIYEEEFNRLRQGVEVVEGVFDILDRLETANIPFCVASNGGLDKMAITLGQTGLMERFGGHLFSAYVLGIAKPDPALFLAATKAFDVAPEDAVVIEDSLSGVTGAARAKMRCFAYAPHNDPGPLAATGAVPFKRMEDLLRLLNLP